MPRRISATAPLTPRAVIGSLQRTYGVQKRAPRGQPFHHLVLGILMEGSTYEHAEQALAQLTKTFVDFNEVRVASVSDVAAALGTIEDAREKAQSVKHACALLFAAYNYVGLDFLIDKAESTAKRHLAKLKKISPNAVEYTLLHSLGINACPVTERLVRVAKRLGLVPRHLAQQEAADELRAVVPPRSGAAFALLMDLHADRICSARSPACGECPLARHCEAYGARS